MVHARLRSLTENVGYDIRRLIAEAADGLIYLLQEIPRNTISIHVTTKPRYECLS